MSDIRKTSVIHRIPFKHSARALRPTLSWSEMARHVTSPLWPVKNCCVPFWTLCTTHTALAAYTKYLKKIQMKYSW